MRSGSGATTDPPGSSAAYLARLAFGEGDYRVFYNDMIAAVQWLSQT